MAMRRLASAILILTVVRIPAQRTAAQDSGALAPLSIDYPENGSIFPPEITPPAFLWRDSPANSRAWLIEVDFNDGAPGIRLRTTGAGPRIGEIDQRAVSSTNELPKLAPEQAAAHSWTPPAPVWAEIKRRSVERQARVTITGFRDKNYRVAVSRGAMALQTSEDPAGAPVFYRDVPLMPSELERGVIKPLAPAAVPLIAWRLRNIGEPRSRLLLDGVHSCANCHSFSNDGKTLGMDLDGPQNDKGLYAITAVQRQTSVRNEDLISWRSFRDQPAGQMRVGFMSQLSPDGQYVITTVGAEKDLSRNYYVANFKDYRFLQVFYATRGILVWYSRATRERRALPGADDPAYVQTNGVWSPDGRYVVFARAEAKDAYPEGQKMAERANDPNETQVRYDLYRVPFNGGKGGKAEPIAGASRNGMSNSFPKVSPDGRWIVFVQARNGLLMRPDSQLFIVPAQGGEARRMRCNGAPMNSWHSFSPNGRWLVFSSKRRSPYTQMYLTHIDENGNDSPAILIENATAQNRAVNIPEFVNVPPDGLLKLEMPAADFYARFERAWQLAEQGQYKASVAEWRTALAMNPDDAKAHNNIGFALAKEGQLDEAITHWNKALELNEDYAEVRKNLGRALFDRGRLDEAIGHWRKLLESAPGDGQAHGGLGAALLKQGKVDEAIAELRRAIELDPEDAGTRYNSGLALLRKGRFDEAIPQLEAALRLNPTDAQAHNDLGVALLQKRSFDEAVVHFGKATELDRKFAQAYFNLGNAFYLQRRIANALEQWRAGLRLEPDNLVVLRQAAWLLATDADAALRNGAEAVRFATRALELSGPADPAALDGLAAAYAEARRFPEAVETARRALSLAEAQNKPALAEALKARIALYEKQQPWRASAPPR